MHTALCLNDFVDVCVAGQADAYLWTSSDTFSAIHLDKFRHSVHVCVLCASIIHLGKLKHFVYVCGCACLCIVYLYVPTPLALQIRC